MIPSFSSPLLWIFLLEKDELSLLLLLPSLNTDASFDRSLKSAPAFAEASESVSESEKSAPTCS